MLSSKLRLVFATCLASFVAVALADDSAITWSGAPKMLSGHPTIKMVSEKIVLTVNATADGYTDADCTFIFHNDGPACSVRIGFPDRTRGADEGNFVKGGTPDFPHPTFHMLDKFRSWVDGKEVKTTVVLAQSPNIKGATYGGSWHVKVVNFKANQTVTVRDTYRQPQSGGASMGGYLNQIQYIMSTGASWNGPIGSAEVDVHIPGLTAADPLSSITTKSPYEYEGWSNVKPGQVYYLGFAKPEIDGDTLVFKRENFKPTVASDINVYMPLQKRN